MFLIKIRIIGKGHVGSSLAYGLAKAGHQIRFGHRDPNESVHEAARWSEVVILAVPYENVKGIAKEIGNLVDGKPVIDVTNVIGPDDKRALGFTTSGAEELQKLLPKAHVVKAFNTVFAENQKTGKIGKEQLTAFVACDDPKSKSAVMQLARDVGFDPVDAGPLRSARYLEPMGLLVIDLAYEYDLGTEIGCKLIRAETGK